MSRSNRTLLLAICAGLVFGGCSTAEHEDLKAWMAEQAKDMKGRVPPIPEIKPFPVVAYEGESQRSPFSPDKSVAGDGLKDPAAPDSSRARQPLENFPLDSLRVTGVIFDGRKHVAMISTPPPNKPKRVSIGEFVGQNYGKVVSIDADGVHLIELYKDQNGAWTERPFTLSVAREGNRK